MLAVERVGQRDDGAADSESCGGGGERISGPRNNPWPKGVMIDWWMG